MLLPNTPHYMVTANRCWKWHSAIKCELCCIQEHEFVVIMVPSWVNSAWSMNRISGRIYSCGCSHSQNHKWLVWSPGKRSTASAHHCCSHSALTCGEEPLSLKVLCTISNVLWFEILQSSISAIAALPFPLQKLKTKCMLAYPAFVNMFGILTTHHHGN